MRRSFCWVAVVAGSAAAWTGCGRGLPFDGECPSGEVRRNGRCVVPPNAPDGGVGFPDAGVGPGIAAIDRADLQFGTRLLGSETRRTIRFSNPGAPPATVRFRRISDGAFGLDEVGLSDPIVIPGGGTAVIGVLFVPGAPGTFTGVFDIELCDGGCEVSIMFVGVGVLDPLTCESPLDFGVVPLRSCQVAEVQCSSAIDDPLFVSAVDLDARSGPFRLPLLEPFDVPPGGAAEFPAEFCPVFEAPAQAVLRVSARAADVSRTFGAARLVGVGVASTECNLQLPSVVDFGGVAPMEAEERVVQVTNTGALPCAITFDGIDGAQEAFRLLSPVPGQTLAIAAGQSFDVAVEFSPPAPQDYEARLLYDTNDPRFPAGEIALRGAGLTDQTYRVTSRSSAPFSPLQGASVAWATGDSDDGYADITLPFSFSFLGRSTRFVRVSTNGFVMFASRGGREFQNQLLPNQLTPNALVALWWDDLYPGRPDVPGLVTTRTSSQNGQTVFHIAYIGVAALSGTPERISGEIRLYADTGVIELHYGSYVDTPAADQFRASAGWEGFSGIRGADILGCGSRCSGRDFPTNTIYTLTPESL